MVMGWNNNKDEYDARHQRKLIECVCFQKTNYSKTEFYSCGMQSTHPTTKSFLYDRAHKDWAAALTYDVVCMCIPRKGTEGKERKGEKGDGVIR